MTGFGRAVAKPKFGRLTVEIQSVNRKYLEVFISLPKEFGRFEHEVRKWATEAVSRGQVSIRIFLESDKLEEILPDVKMLKGLKKEWEKIAKQLGTDPKEITLPFLMQNRPSQTKQELARDEDLPALKKCVEEALESLLKMKKAEGKALAQDLSTRLKGLEKKIDTVESQAPDATKRMRQKLFERMEEVLKPGVETEERLLREVALFAERVDISEEITRFRSHVAQFKDQLKGTVVGRKMDFLIQEFGREVNTIGSKSMDTKISHIVVELKSELEKMREQIQNIE
jgi:uncharacterized protein (TIGR00255 family)